MNRSLPILNLDPTLSAAELLRLFHRAQLHWRQHLGDEIPCDSGTVVVNAEQPRFNTILDASLNDGMDASAAYANIQTLFARHGGGGRWIMNPSAPADAVRPLIDQLTTQGFHPRTQQIFHRTPAQSAASPSVSSTGLSLKIIPARAALVQAEQLAQRAAAELNHPEEAEASALHLDDGHFDALIALAGSEPAARIGVLSVGEIGLIEQLHVLREFRGQGVGRLMLGRALEICTRSQFRHVFMAADSPCPLADRLLPEAGFQSVGEFTIYGH